MNWQFASKKIGLVFFLTGVFLVLFGALAFLPHGEVQALQSHAQSADDCSECHSQATDLLADSLHAGIPLSCDNCHKLVPGAEGRNTPSCTIRPKAKRALATVATRMLINNGMKGNTAIST